VKKWIKQPSKFVHDVFGATPDLWQAEALDAFPTSQRMCLKGSKGVAKSTTLAWLIWNFLLTRPYPRIAATSITSENLSDGLWTELQKWRNKSPLLTAKFEWTRTRIFSKEQPETWWASARSWSRSADSEQQGNTLAGLHEDYLLFVIDEAGGVPDAVVAAAEAGLATGKETKLVIAGNPTHLEGPIHRACTRERHLWKLFEVTGDPDDPKRSPRVSIQWAKEQIEKYGRENPWVQVNVFGRFPSASINSLLGVDEVSAAMQRDLSDEAYEFSQKRLGIDVARFGDARTVIFPRQGLLASNPVEIRNARSHEIAARVALAKSRWHSEMEFIDDTGGYGAGVIDALLQAGHAPTPINFSGKAIDPRYFNKRSEMWFEMADWVKRGGALPHDPGLARELTTPTYTFQGGKFRLEEKEQIQERLGFSPDLADALALTFALPEMPRAGVVLPGGERAGKLEHEYDPFDSSRL